MKKLFLLAVLALPFIAAGGFAQNTASIKAEIKFTYSILMPNPVTGEPLQNDIIAYILKTGDVFYKNTSPATEPDATQMLKKYTGRFDSSTIELMKKTIETAYARQKMMADQGFVHFDPETRIRRSHLFFADKNRFIDVLDTMPAMNWVLTDSFKNIGTFSCQKATGRFRDQNYIAWFTTEIPVQSGPHSITGLPGLILEAVNTDSREFYFFKELQMPVNETLPASLFKNAEETMSYADFKKGFDRQNKMIKMQSQEKRIQ